MGFWENLDTPIMALAPLHDVTDTVFRQMIAREAKPDVMLTEFASVDGLLHERSRQKMIWRYLQFTDIERPLVAQIWGVEPGKFEQAARLVADLGFDGIDINMGCPEKSAIKHGACAALIDQPKLAQEIIQATKKGAGDLPISVKTRLGFRENIVEEWTKYLLEAELAVITMHGRIAKHMSRVPADWDSIGRVAALAQGSGTLVLGNGDVNSLAEAEEKCQTYGVDGVMFGRAIFHNHWLFDPAYAKATAGKTQAYQPTDQEKLEAMVEHAKLYEKVFKLQRSFAVLRKHFKTYTLGIKGAKDLRVALMSAKSADEVGQLVKSWLKHAP